MNERVSKLRETLFTTKPLICHERAKYFTESMKQSEGEHIAIRRAKGMCNVMEKMTIFVKEGELILGNIACSTKASAVYPEYSIDWIKKEFDGDPYYFDQRPGDNFYYTEESKKEILEAIEYWEGKSLYETFRKILPEECNRAWDAGVIDDTWVSSAGLGNTVVDFELVLKSGLEGVIEKAKERLSRMDLSEPDQYKKYCFLKAVIMANEGVMKFSERYADKCEVLAFSEKDEKRKKELLELSHICRNVPAKPAQNFWEALQSVWFILMIQHLETNGHSVSLGRFDQYLWPYYEKDIKEGKLTKDSALEMIEAFFIKCNELNKVKSWPDSSFFLGYQMFINLAVGGQTADGKDAVNDISYLCVQACGDIKLFTPSISVKCFEGTDDKFIDAALVALQEHKGGMPAFYNDKAFMNTLKNMGVADEDLYNWVPDGCIEASIGGKWDFAAKGPWLNVCKVLEIALNNGIDPATGTKICEGYGDLSTFSDMEQIRKAFKDTMRYIIKLQVITEHVNDYLHCEKDLNVFRSSLISDCIERGLDLIEGGSIYSADGGPTAGSITAGDALAAIEYAVFDEKLFIMQQLKHALETNYEDDTTSPTGTEIRKLMQNRAPKFGNDDERADKWVVDVEDFIGRTYRYDCKNSRYGKGPVPACFSYSQSPVTGNIAFGAFVGATPDGRKASEPVNNGISPNNGVENKGPTAVINSVVKLPSVWFQKGAILNMRLTPNALLSGDRRKRVIALIRTLFSQNGQHIQFNVVDTKTYLEAQASPEEFPDLMVRVSGYSALFTPLSKAVQDDVIARMQMDI